MPKEAVHVLPMNEANWFKEIQIPLDHKFFTFNGGIFLLTLQQLVKKK